MEADQFQSDTPRSLVNAQADRGKSPVDAEMQISSPSTTELEDGTRPPAWRPSFRVYAIVIGLGITNLLAALENTVVSVAAPVFLTELQLGDNFIWITNAFFLCRYVI